jgi:4-amino-4-deoxy-L-arabinose transferase-like glycosyltransferase
MTDAAPPRSRLPLAAAAVVFVVHAAANPHYGFFRDELYFIVCGRHPALGYVDQPPIVPLLAAASQLLGPSLFLLRLVAAAFAAASIYVTCRLARELGGGRFAQLLAAVTAALCPVLCSFGMKVSTDMPALWLWPLVALYLVRLARGADPRLWLAVGAALGMSALSKYSVVYFAAALLVGLACTPQRRILASRWFFAGAALAIALALPNFAWQARHGFPMLELLRHGQAGKNVILSPAAYLGTQLLITNPVLALCWLAGLVWLLQQRAWRFLGIGFVALIAMMIASHAKHYYPAAVYPILFAAGGVAVEAWTARHRRARPAVVAVAAVGGLLLIPYVLPVLPVPAFLAYHSRIARVLHTDESLRTEHTRYGALPQDWADMHGWPELAAAVERVYRALPPDERARAAIVAGNYGEAAAIDFFASGLPPTLSGHNQYFLWGPRGASGDVIIDVHGDCGARDHLFASSERAATVSAPLAMPSEAELPIMVCRGIRTPLPTLWPQLKWYY